MQNKCMTRNTGANGAFVEGCFTMVKEQIFEHTEIVGGVSGRKIFIRIGKIFTQYTCSR